MIKITRPTLLLDETIARRNIKTMATKARQHNVELIPHFKTHQSKKIGGWFREEGVSAITVSSVAMAGYFANDGWQKITIAFPLNIREINAIAELATRVELTLLITNTAQVRALQEHVEVFVNVLIEVDTGDHRSGVPADEPQQIRQLIDLLAGTQHRFKGFYSHFGHTYKAANGSEVTAIYHAALQPLTDLRFVFADTNPEIHLGDTPSASLSKDFTGVTALHAGNFVFYDLTQVQLGSCREEDIAVALACPVVGKNSHRQELVIYGGGIHLSKESLPDRETGKHSYGKVVLLTDDHWSGALPGCYVRSLSQEHGIVQVTPDVLAQITPGDVIGLLPVHACMTADTMAGYRNFKGEKIDHFNACRWPAG